MRRLDRSRDFGTVTGSDTAGVCYEQDGIEFNAMGIAVGDPIPPSDVDIAEAEEADAAAQETPADPYDGMHWKQLKALVEQFGGEWSNVSDAKAYLRGQR